jgi:hypothetical protein
MSRLPLHYDAPPCKPNVDGDLSCGFGKLPEELKVIINMVVVVEGALLMSLDGDKCGQSKVGAFHASIKLPEYRSVPGDGYDDLAEDVLRARELQSMLAMRLVNQ